MELRRGEVSVPPGHGQGLVPQQLGDGPQRHVRLPQATGESVPEIVPAEIFDSRRPNCSGEPVTALLEKWGRLHGVRSILGAAGLLVFVSKVLLR